jgi:hypothetical protein
VEIVRSLPRVGAPAGRRVVHVLEPVLQEQQLPERLGKFLAAAVVRGHQLLDAVGTKITVDPGGAGKEPVLELLPQGAALGKPMPQRQRKSEFPAVQKLVVEILAQIPPQQVLSGPGCAVALLPQVYLPRDGGGELGHADIGERCPRLQAVHHAGDVDLGQQVVRQIGLDVDVLAELLQRPAKRFASDLLEFFDRFSDQMRELGPP